MHAQGIGDASTPSVGLIARVVVGGNYTPAVEETLKGSR